jgi:molecular chaperone DnaJ
LTLLPATTYGVGGMDKPKDYYQLLGVPRDASRTAIKRAFKRLAREYEPRGGETSRDAFAELQVAYETLSDDERRRRYDDELGRADRFPASDFGLVRRPAAGDLRRPYTPASLSAEIVLRADEAIGGAVLSLDVPVTANCEACSGTGGALFDCERCQGEGKVSRRLPVPVHVPPGLRDGAVFQVRTDDPAVPSILLTVHLRRA